MQRLRRFGEDAVGDPNGPPLQAERIIETLHRYGVNYVLVGGLAATVHGASRVTFDIDVVPEWTVDNRGRLAQALAFLNAGLRVPGQRDAVPFPLDATTFTKFEVSTWRTDAGDLDVIVGLPTHLHGVLRGYEELRSRSAESDFDGPIVAIGSLDDIIESKAALGRPTDLVALPELLALRAAQHDQLACE